MKSLITSAATTITLTASLLLCACEKSSPNSSTTPATGAKSGTTSSTGAANAAQDQVAAATESLESLGVTLPSFDELRAKASQAITPENADAEFERLQLEAEAEGG